MFKGQQKWLCWSLQHVLLIPQVFSWVEFLTQCRPFHPGSVGKSVDILEDGFRSQILEIWDCHCLQNLIPMTSSVLLVREILPPHHHTVPIERCHMICVTICIAFSTPSPYFDPTTQCQRAVIAGFLAFLFSSVYLYTEHDHVQPAPHCLTRDLS